METKKPGSDAQAEFAAAAREVVADAPETAPSPSLPSDASGPEILEKLSVSEDYAREAVKLCFWPVAHYVDPAWALTDEEAQSATPQMQAFLRWLLMKYAPALTLKLASRFPEVLALVLAMALVAWRKAQVVMEAQAERQPQVASAFSSVDAAVDAVQSGEAIVCEVCKNPFLSRESLAGHLPCSGGVR